MRAKRVFFKQPLNRRMMTNEVLWMVPDVDKESYGTVLVERTERRFFDWFGG
jgi:hypothetical protein